MTDRAPDDPRYSPVMIRAQLIEDGWTDKAITRQVRNGAWVRIRRGAYVDRTAWLRLTRSGQHEMLARAVVVQGKTDLIVSHTSALPFYDLSIWDIRLDDVDVTRPDGRCGRHEAGVRQHRGVLVPGDVVTRHGIRVVAPTRLALEMTVYLDPERALVVVDQLLHRRLTTPEELRRAVDDASTWPSSLLSDFVVRRADGRHESVGESRFAHMCHEQRLPRPEPQYEVPDATGRIVRRLDFALPAYEAYFEFDGKQKYDELVPDGMTPAQVIMAEKAREKEIWDLLGWICIRITWDDLRHPVRTAARIRSMLEGRLAA